MKLEDEAQKRILEENQQQTQWLEGVMGYNPEGNLIVLYQLELTGNSGVSNVHNEYHLGTLILFTKHCRH